MVAGAVFSFYLDLNRLLSFFSVNYFCSVNSFYSCSLTCITGLMNPFSLSIITEIKGFSYGFLSSNPYSFLIFLVFDGRADGNFKSAMSLLKDLILWISSCIYADSEPVLIEFFRVEKYFAFRAESFCSAGLQITDFLFYLGLSTVGLVFYFLSSASGDFDF